MYSMYGKMQGAGKLASNIPSYTGNDYAYAAGFASEKIVEYLVLKKVGNVVGARLASAAEGGSTFFEGAKYSDKVLRQMGKVDDIYHAFPKSVDGYATKFGQWSTKLGADGNPYQWLKMPGSYGGKTGVFEYTKDANGLINHRFFNVPKVP